MVGRVLGNPPALRLSLANRPFRAGSGGTDLALAALIIATEDADGGAGLRATLPLLGRTLVEHQVRQVAAAGAAHVVVLVERIPAELIAAIDRLRRGGLTVEVARTIADAADRFHPDERLYLIADGCIADQSLLDALAATPGAIVATVPDQADTADHERIDAAVRWAGVALLDGAAIQATAAMLGDWDAQSTLLRRAVQTGAQRVDTAVLGGGRPRIVRDHAILDILDRHLLRRARVLARRWPQRWLFAPVEGPVAGWLAAHAAAPTAVAIAAAALAATGVAAAALGWTASGTGLALLSGPLAATAGRLARLRLGTVRRGSAIEATRVTALATGLAVIASVQVDWGWWLMAGFTILLMLALRPCLHLRHTLVGDDGPIWIANPDALAWTLAAVVIVAGWRAGLAVSAAYATLSFFSMQLELGCLAARETANGV